ncbi:kelch-like protein diablo [Caerostris extrusa]|uniref:Kelch-like protein diablo n=1 Tax=Caerostris extrusa TaxID=172846 RepID=A0AAV4RCK0_CAEEX|nr:kelch-like protein diablo [Caerostris extrusa]
MVAACPSSYCHQQEQAPHWAMQAICKERNDKEREQNRFLSPGDGCDYGAEFERGEPGQNEVRVPGGVDGTEGGQEVLRRRPADGRRRGFRRSQVHHGRVQPLLPRPLHLQGVVRQGPPQGAHPGRHLRHAAAHRPLRVQRRHRGHGGQRGSPAARRRPIQRAGHAGECTQFLLRKMDAENCIGFEEFARCFFVFDLEQAAQRSSVLLARSSWTCPWTRWWGCSTTTASTSGTRSWCGGRTAVDRTQARREEEARGGDHAMHPAGPHGHPVLHGEGQDAQIRGEQRILQTDRDRDAALPLGPGDDWPKEGCGGDSVFSHASHPLLHPLHHRRVEWGSPTNLIETYDTKADRWIKVKETDPAGPRAYHKLAVIGYDIYVIGGFDGNDYFNSCRCFNAISKEWRDIAPMHTKRCYVSVAALDNLIYAMGGYDGHHRQNTVERYDLEINQWTFVAPMNVQRSDASATALNGRVYIVGGFNGSECLASAEFYNPQTDQWTVTPSMKQRRSGVSVISHHGRIYALGGFNGISRLVNGEYDPESDQWTHIPDMFNPRSNFAIEALKDGRSERGMLLSLWRQNRRGRQALQKNIPMMHDM